MWLKDDLEQLKQNWKQSPWWVRLWMGVSLFLAVSSLASLSETVADWKGFFLDAIQFYRNWISRPLRDFAAALDFRFSLKTVDYLVLQAVFISTAFRTLVLSSMWKQWSDRARRVNLWFLVSATAMLFYVLGYMYGNGKPEPPDSTVPIVIASWIIWPVLFWRQYDFARIFLIQIAAVLLVLGILGAISAGLSEGE